ncbi:hypothetical protein G9A89_023393 [Geosiphon pyriformis]|nr:hypothetical protein G9A89_023393 [Geosiphon pyriformis]
MKSFFEMNDAASLHSVDLLHEPRKHVFKKDISKTVGDRFIEEVLPSDQDELPSTSPLTDKNDHYEQSGLFQSLSRFIVANFKIQPHIMLIVNDLTFYVSPSRIESDFDLAELIADRMKGSYADGSLSRSKFTKCLYVFVIWVEANRLTPSSSAKGPQREEMVGRLPGSYISRSFKIGRFPASPIENAERYAGCHDREIRRIFIPSRFRSPNMHGGKTGCLSASPPEVVRSPFEPFIVLQTTALLFVGMEIRGMLRNLWLMFDDNTDLSRRIPHQHPRNDLITMESLRKTVKKKK